MKKGTILFLFFEAFLIVFLFCLSFVMPVNAQVGTSAKLEALWYLKNEPRSMESFEENVAKIDVLGPQTYFLLVNGQIRSIFPDKILQLKNEKNRNLKVMPLLANITFYKDVNGNTKEYFDQRIIKNLLDDKKNWQKVSDYMRDEAKKNGFYGWQMDLENIPISHKGKFSDYIKFLKSEFDKDGLKLSIAVVSKISDNKNDYEKSYWENWAGAYDWKVLAESTDFLSIMTYDQPRSPGPVATIQWSKKVLDYAVKTIPKEKISFGIPVYGWAYRSEDLKKGKKHFSMVDFPFTNSKVAQPLITSPLKRGENPDAKTGSGSSKVWGDIPWVSYNYGGKNYTVWYEDKNSFQTKYQQLKNTGVRGYSVWVLGDEDPSIWESKNS